MPSGIRKEEMVAIQTKLYKGFVTDTILNAVQLHSPDLIVMGTLGSAGGKERILGSKTAGVIGKTNVPVLVIPLLSETLISKKFKPWPKILNQPLCILMATSLKRE